MGDKSLPLSEEQAQEFRKLATSTKNCILDAIRRLKNPPVEEWDGTPYSPATDRENIQRWAEQLNGLTYLVNSLNDYVLGAFMAGIDGAVKAAEAAQDTDEEENEEST